MNKRTYPFPEQSVLKCDDFKTEFFGKTKNRQAAATIELRLTYFLKTFKVTTASWQEQQKQ
jgi:hypothetical protein